MKNILVVDNDLEFVYWLGEVLIGAGYQPWPACTIPDATTIAGRNPMIPLGLLIVNPSLPGASHLVSLCRRSQAHLKVMALGSRDEKALPGVSVWREKPTRKDQSARRDWVRAIDRVSRGYKRAA